MQMVGLSMGVASQAQQRRRGVNTLAGNEQANQQQAKDGKDGEVCIVVCIQLSMHTCVRVSTHTDVYPPAHAVVQPSKLYAYNTRCMKAKSGQHSAACNNAAIAPCHTTACAAEWKGTTAMQL